MVFKFIFTSTFLLVAIAFSSGIELECGFEDYSFIWGSVQYSCQVKELQIVEPSVAVGNVIGDHQEGKSNDEVLQVVIDEQTVNYLPDGVAQLFINLKALIVQDSQLKKIEKKDFQNMQNLNALLLAFNSIAEIPEDTFADLGKLEYLSLASNELTALNDNVFSGLKNLERLHLNENKIERLENALFTHNEELKVIWLQGNRLSFIGSALLTPVKNPTEVFLGSNRCIHNWFPGPKSLEELVEEIAEKCQS